MTSVRNMVAVASAKIACAGNKVTNAVSAVCCCACLAIGVVSFVSPVGAAAQDVSYSQTYEAPLYLSPSFTGLTNGVRFVGNYRNQWPGVGSVYQNYSISVDNFFEAFKSGLGLLWEAENQGKGLLVDNEVGLLYAYEFPLIDNIFMRPGLQFKVGQRMLDHTKMITFTDISSDGSYVFGGSSIDIENDRSTRIDATASVMVYNDDFWGGLTVDHLIRPDVSFTDAENKLGLKFVVFGGYRWTYEPSYRGSDPKTVTLALKFMRQYSFNQLELGAFWYYMPIEIGISYRGLFVPMAGEISNNDAVIPSIGINVMPNLRVGYSYDLTISDVSSFGNGAHEVSLIYRLVPGEDKKKSFKMKPIPCSEPIGGYEYKYKKKNKPRKGIRR